MWIKRWRIEIWSEPVRPGIWRVKAGGFLLTTWIRTAGGKRRQCMARIGACPVPEAQREFDAFRARKERELGAATPSGTLFAVFAVSLFQRKVRAREIRSAKGVEKWRTALGKHLIPAFGEIPMGLLRHGRIAQWRAELAERVAAPRTVLVGDKRRRNPEHLSPRTCNTLFSVLKVITKAAGRELDLERDPAAALAMFSTLEHPTYTDERPNSLTAAEAHAFVARMRELYPQHYAMTVLGFATGLRPSSLRPLRRSGPLADLAFLEGGGARLRVRRSHSLGASTMGSTKTGRWQTIHLPPELAAILREHNALATATALEDKREPSDLLFPSKGGGFRARSVLDVPFRVVSEAIGLAHPITPRAMRRTFQDLARLAAVGEFVTRSISGHSTSQMQEHYSTAQAEEQSSGIARVVRLIDRRRTA